MKVHYSTRPRDFAVTSLAWIFLLAALHANPGRAANLMPLTGATQVAAGTYFTCALMSDATVKCWGYNGGGELGDGTTTSSNYAATSVAGLSAVSAIAGGEHHACALLAGGTVRCWGNNVSGQIGDGTSGPLAYKTTPVAVSGLANVSMIAVGYAHSCALLAAGTVACWGDDAYGELGNGTSGSYSSIPVMVSGITTAIGIAAGDNHNCAVLADRTVKCWGGGGVGQLGNGANSNSSTPVVVTGLSAVSAIWGGALHTCTLNTANTVKCWGSDGAGELGDGSATLTSHNTYVTSNYSGAIQLGTGNQFTCALRGDGLAGCWGDNSVGQAGSGVSTTPLLTPAAVGGLAGATAISVHGAHACVLVPNGTVQCWGQNGNGQLGDESNTDRNGPVNVLTTAATYIVTPSASTGGSISPLAPQTVPIGATVTFTITPVAGYQLAAVSASTCQGSLTGGPVVYTYTTAPVTADCAVSAAFTGLSAPPAPTTSTLQLAPDPATVGQGVTATVKVTGSASATPTGTVLVSSGAMSCMAPLDGTGAGSCALSFPVAGVFSVTAAFAGDGGNAASNAVASETVTAAAVNTPAVPAPALSLAALLGLVLLLIAGTWALRGQRSAGTRTIE